MLCYAKLQSVQSNDGALKIVSTSWEVIIIISGAFKLLWCEQDDVSFRQIMQQVFFTLVCYFFCCYSIYSLKVLQTGS